MRGHLQALAVSLYQLPEWLEVRSMTLESTAGEQAIPLPLNPNAAMPTIEGPFTIRIDVAPDRTW